MLVGAAALVVVLWQYNAIVSLRQLTRNAWADVDVYLKRRAELIPNLVAAVQAYAQHEQTALEKVMEARAKAIGMREATGERAETESQITSGVSRVLALAESYPELKASANFIQLQRELIDTEKLIAHARQFYNACVRDFNTRIESFPGNLVAGVAGARHMAFFEIENLAERDVPGVGA
ncbi:MAG TPA: LemA family protein [Fimbriimonadaceae bacterium]|nr:LemA family protein [Fimbriimonadaceae bacterium]